MLIFKKIKFVDFANVSVTCKRFFLIKLIKNLQKQSFSKRIIKFDEYYNEFLQNWLLDLQSSHHKKFNEELSSDIFSVINIKIQNISYELTPFKLFCYCFFCTRGSRSAERCLICSIIFVNKNDIAKTIDRITRNFIKDLDVFLFRKCLNTQCVILNIYYLVGNYSYQTENFNELFCEIASALFGVYILFLFYFFKSI